jgi:hypothetical protein
VDSFLFLNFINEMLLEDFLKFWNSTVSPGKTTITIKARRESHPLGVL